MVRLQKQKDDLIEKLFIEIYFKSTSHFGFQLDSDNFFIYFT